MIDARLLGSTNRAPEVTDRNQLVTGQEKPSRFYLGATASNGVAVNVVPPESGKKFIITGIWIDGDRSIGANGAVTDVFENSVGPTDGTITKQVIQAEVPKQDTRPFSPLYIETTQGRWINVKSDDVIVRCNIAGYYVDA